MKNCVIRGSHCDDAAHTILSDGSMHCVYTASVLSKAHEMMRRVSLPTPPLAATAKHKNSVHILVARAQIQVSPPRASGATPCPSCKQQGIPAEQQRIIFGGKQLSGADKQLSDFELEEGNTLHLVLRLRGGPEDDVPSAWRSHSVEERQGLGWFGWRTSRS